MVDAGVRHVERADPVGQHAHPLPLKAAQNRTRGIGPEGRRRDPRLTRQRLADGRPHFARERFASQHADRSQRSEEHTSELQSLMRISYAVFCLKTKKKTKTNNIISSRTSTHSLQLRTLESTQQD